VSHRDSTPPSKRRERAIFLAVSAVAFVALVIAGYAIILPFLLAVLLAYVLFPAVKRVERLRMPRWAAILLVYAVTLGATFGFIRAVVPRLFEETKNLGAELPKLTQRVREEWLPVIDARLMRWTGTEPTAEPAGPPIPPEPTLHVKKLEDGSFEVHLNDEVELRKQSDDVWIVQRMDQERKPLSTERALSEAFDEVVAYAQRNSLELLRVGRAIVAGVSRFVFFFFLTLMLAGYMMYTYERIHGFVREMWPEYRRASFDRFMRRLDRGFAGVVRGQLLICLVNGVLSAIGFWIFDLKYWPILSLVAAIMSIIPIFGSILSSVPAVAIGLTQGFGTAFGVLVWIIGIHQLEANFLNPKIIGDAAHIHPILVVFSLLLGEHFFGITGALLAVPTLALAQTIFMHFRESVLGLPDPRSSILPPSAPSGEAAKVPKPPPIPEDAQPLATDSSK
jgi:predicted PurR-regulated permease PerM